MADLGLKPPGSGSMVGCAAAIFINSFEYKDNRYAIDISIKVATNSYILALGKYRDEIGQISIKAKGDFDLQRSSDANPYGMNINNFSITAVTKPNVK